MAQTRRVSGRATQIVRMAGGIGVQYHNTVVAFKKGETVTLNSGGWRTVTTKLRMNQFAAEYCGDAFGVYQKAGEWYVHLNKPGITVPYVDGLEVAL